MGTTLLQAVFLPNKAKQKTIQLLADASPPSRLLRKAVSLEVHCWLTLFHHKEYTHCHKGLHLRSDDTSKLLFTLNSPSAQHKGAAGSHTFHFGGLLLHVLGMSLAQVVRRCHSWRGKGHVADGTTLVPVFPAAAFLLAVLCTQNHRAAEAGRDLCRSPRPTSLSRAGTIRLRGLRKQGNQRDLGVQLNKCD